MQKLSCMPMARVGLHGDCELQLASDTYEQPRSCVELIRLQNARTFRDNVPGQPRQTTGRLCDGKLSPLHQDARSREEDGKVRAKDVMTADVVTVGPETSVTDVAQTLLERRISAAPVVDGNGAVIGIVSEGDLVRRSEIGTDKHRSWWLRMFADSGATAAAYIKSHGRVAADVMTTDVVTSEEDATLEEIATLLEERGIKRLPVLRDGKLVGIVSRANLLQGLVAAGVSGSSEERDETIRLDIRRVLGRDAGVPDKFIDVTVRDGVVHLWGVVSRQIERKAARIAVEGVAGVREVHDHLGVIPRTPPIDLGAD